MANDDYESFNWDDGWFIPNTVEDYLAMDYDTLKEYIYKNQNSSLLKESSIKKKLIDSPRKYDFIWFVQDASFEILASLLDREGMEILKNTTDLDSKLNAIITCGISCPFVFQSDSFCEMVLKYWFDLNFLFSHLDDKEALPFFQYLENHNPDKVEDLFLRLNANTQVAVLKEKTFPLDLVKKFLVKGKKETIEYITFHDARVQSLSEFSISELYSLATKRAFISPYYLHQRSFIEKLSTIGSVKNYRYLMNELSRANDVSEIEDARKEYYEKEISSYNKENQMLERHLIWYQEICHRMDTNGEDIFDLFDKFLTSYYGRSSEEYDIRKRIIEFYRNKDKEGLKKFLQQESRLQLTNMVIDYHFEEIPYNFFLDLKQLVHFQEGEGKTLSSEEIETYSKLLVLDDLPYEELLKLHSHLKEHSMVEEYYDHFRSAKDKQADLIEKAMLTDTTVQKYKDEKLSNRAGVPIYVLDGEEFYAFVKSSHLSKDYVLGSNCCTYIGDGGSFSLDGSNKLKTFQDPREIYTFIYKSIPRGQIIHTYPVDSYSNYRRETDISTHRVYELLTPEELVSKSMTYNEVLLALPNSSKEHDELQTSLQGPELLGIYCYDIITDNDVLSAKNMGIGIVLVKTKSYQIDTSNRMRLIDTHLNGGSQSEYDYLLDISVNDMESRRK